MFNVCPSCGMYAVEKEILPGEGCHALAVCPHCQYAHPFLRLPLFVVSGASGTGKTAVALELSAQDRAFLHLESDILWREEFNRPEEDYQAYRETWLRVAKNIGQAGRPVILYGSVAPGRFEICLERRYFSHVYTLALACQPDLLAERLRARPAWRNAGGAEFVEDMLAFNRWFCETSSPDLDVLDTSQASLSETARAVLDWAARRWDPENKEEKT